MLLPRAMGHSNDASSCVVPCLDIGLNTPLGFPHVDQHVGTATYRKPIHPWLGWIDDGDGAWWGEKKLGLFGGAGTSSGQEMEPKVAQKHFLTGASPHP